MSAWPGGRPAAPAAGCQPPPGGGAGQPAPRPTAPRPAQAPRPGRSSPRAPAPWWRLPGAAPGSAGKSRRAERTLRPRRRWWRCRGSPAARWPARCPGHPAARSTTWSPARSPAPRSPRPWWTTRTSWSSTAGWWWATRALPTPASRGTWPSWRAAGAPRPQGGAVPHQVDGWDAAVDRESAFDTVEDQLGLERHGGRTLGRGVRAGGAAAAGAGRLSLLELADRRAGQALPDR